MIRMSESMDLLGWGPAPHFPCNENCIKKCLLLLVQYKMYNRLKLKMENVSSTFKITSTY